MQQTHQCQDDVSDDKTTTKQCATKIKFPKGINICMPVEGKLWRVAKSKPDTIKCDVKSTVSG